MLNGRGKELNKVRKLWIQGWIKNWTIKNKKTCIERRKTQEKGQNGEFYKLKKGIKKKLEGKIRREGKENKERKK